MECVKVGTLVSGEIDCADFKVKLLENSDKPAIINVNIGKSSAARLSLLPSLPLDMAVLQATHEYVVDLC